MLAALTLILLGWAVAALARRLTTRILSAAELDVRCARWGLTGVLGRAGHRPSLTELVSRLVYWGIFRGTIRIPCQDAAPTNVVAFDTWR